MNIYEIDEAIRRVLEEAVDFQTGEISAEAAAQIDALNMERDTKIENVALWNKNLKAEAKAIADEIKALQERKKRLENKAAWQERYLDYALAGQRFESPRVAITYRKSVTVEISDPDAFCTYYQNDAAIVTTTIDRKPNKAAIKKLLQENPEAMRGAALVEHQNMQIK